MGLNLEIFGSRFAPALRGTGALHYQKLFTHFVREMVGIIAHLTPKGKGLDDSFFVATTHLLYNPHRSDIRLAQLQVFFAELDRVAFCGVDPSIGDLPRFVYLYLYLLCPSVTINYGHEEDEKSSHIQTKILTPCIRINRCSLRCYNTQVDG